jgi:hypothetical protein
LYILAVSASPLLPLTVWKSTGKIVYDTLQYGVNLCWLVPSEETGMFRKQKQWKLTSLVACAG